jgi:hypothetical protein
MQDMAISGHLQLAVHILSYECFAGLWFLFIICSLCISTLPGYQALSSDPVCCPSEHLAQPKLQTYSELD